jgi:hypothetical protein
VDGGGEGGDEWKIPRQVWRQETLALPKKERGKERGGIHTERTWAQNISYMNDFSFLFLSIFTLSLFSDLIFISFFCFIF